MRKPADAARYQVEQEAEGRRNAEVFEADARRQASIAAAQGEAEKARLTGEGDKSRRSALAEAEAIEGARRGEAERSRRIAESEALRAEGEAQAAAILATGQAEAEAMEKRAAAFARYNEAAVLQMLVEVLPQVAREVAAPMAAIDKLTVVSTDGAGALPKQVTANLVQTMELLKNTTGVDLQALVGRFADGGGARAGRASAPARREGLTGRTRWRVTPPLP